MQAYHNDESIKEKYVGRVKKHREMDNIIQGQGWTGQKGCAVGCTLENYEHKQYPIELGIPIQLARIEDVIFEGLPVDIALDWPARFLESINVGANLEFVFPKFNLWVLQHVIKHAIRPETKKSVNAVIKLYEECINLKKPSSDDFLSTYDKLIELLQEAK